MDAAVVYRKARSGPIATCIETLKKVHHVRAALRLLLHKA